MEILEYIGQFTYKDQRQEAARKLAALLQAEDLIIFIKDHELQVWLPGQGFPQTLPNGRQWRTFLSSNEAPVFYGEVPYKDRICPAVALRGFDDSVAVLIGGSPAQSEVNLLQQVLGIVAPLLKQEQLTLVAESKAVQNIKLAEKAERLTATLESIRSNLMRVLNENSSLLQLTEKQNQELAAANEELLAANEEVMANMDELSLTNKRLMSINADLDNFIYTASHDLKSPISNIEGLMNMLTVKLRVQGWEDTSTSQIMAMIGSSINRFKRTISDLTEIAKVGKEGTGALLVPVNLLEVIREVENDLFINIDEAGAQLCLDIGQEVSILFSRKNLKSIIYNLLSNSIKYRDSSRKPLINISWSERPEYHVLAFQDNGIGMDLKKNSHKLFGLFKRLHTHVEGTGIGLYIVKKIIEDGGGKIEVESQVDRGTTFWIYFKKQGVGIVEGQQEAKRR